MTRIQDIGTFSAVREAGHGEAASHPRRASRVGMGTCGTRQRRRGRLPRLRRSHRPATGCDVRLAAVGCFGFCAQEPLVNVAAARPAAGHPAPRAGRATSTAFWTTSPRAPLPEDLALCKIEEWDHLTAHIHYGAGFPKSRSWQRRSRSSSRRRRSCCATAA